MKKYFSKLKSGPEINLAFPKYGAYQWKHGVYKHHVSYVVESLEDSQNMKITWIIMSVSKTHAEAREVNTTTYM